MEFHRLKPGRRYYILAVLVLIGGIAYFTWNLHAGLSRLTDTMIRVVVPGSQLLQLDQAGHYIVFYEYTSRVGDRVYKTGPKLRGLLCEINYIDTDEFVPLKSFHNIEEYVTGSRAGISVFEFEIQEPGTYVLTAFFGEGERSYQVVLAIGHEFRDQLGRVTFRGILAVVVSVIVAFIVTSIVFRKRQQAKERRLKDES